MHIILFFGDSLTAGYGLAQPSLESLPALIQEKIDREKLPYKTVNAGVSGDTTIGGLQRIDLFLSQKPEVFVLELGINDLLRGIPPATTERNLQTIIDKVITRYPDTKLVLLGMEVPAYIAGEYGLQFRAVFRKIAEKNKMAFLPFLLDGVAGIRDLNIHDGVHPSAKGYQIIAKKVWSVLGRLLNA